MIGCPRGLRRTAEAESATLPRHSPGGDTMPEIIFDVRKDAVDGGYSATALGYGIHTQGDSVEEIRRNVEEAVACYFEDAARRPGLIRLRFVRDEAPLA